MSGQAKMLLKMIGPNLNESQLSGVVKELLVQQDEDSDSGDDANEDHDNNVEGEGDFSDMEVDESDAEDEDQAARNPFQEFINTESFSSLKDDYTHERIFAGLIQCASGNVDDVIGWCMDHQDDSDEEIGQILATFLTDRLREIESRGAPTNPKPVAEKPKLTKNQSSKATVAVEPKVKYTDFIRFEFNTKLTGLLSENLMKIWNKFLDKVESLEIKEYLSFQTLAKCLKKISSRFAPKLDRSILTSSLKQGQPNLVICSDLELHAAVLSLYMADKEKPTPCLDEVLICHNDTPVEQVELICRRAFNDQGSIL